MSECDKKRQRFFCPTKWDFFRAIGGLLPHGRAHQSDDWAYGATSNEELPTAQQRWWAAFAEVLAEFSRASCKMLDEFWCATAQDTLALWYKDYGFPDECIEFDNLCAKVAAQGGVTADYLESVARSNGWDINISDGREAHVMDVSVGLGSPAMQYGKNFEAEYPKLTCLLGKTMPAHIWSRIQAEVGTENQIGMALVITPLAIERHQTVLNIDTDLNNNLALSGAVTPLGIARRSMAIGIDNATMAQVSIAGALSNVQILQVQMEVT